MSHYYGETPKSHHLGPQCRLAPVSQPFSPSDVDGIPPIKAQFFYASAIPIDDPLSSSTFNVSADTKTSRASLQPFSQGDNNALERAWLSLASAEHHRNHSHARRSRSPSPSLAKANTDKLAIIVHNLAIKHAEKHSREGAPREMMQPVMDAVDPMSAPGTTISLCCRDLLPDVDNALRTSFCAVARKRQRLLDREKVVQDVMAEATVLRAESEENKRSSVASDLPSGLPLGRRDSAEISTREANVNSRGPLSARNSLAEPFDDTTTFVRSSLPDAGISGKPFVRVGTPEPAVFSPPSSIPRAATPGVYSKTTRRSNVEEKQNSAADAPRTPIPSLEEELPHSSVDVPVGVSRLHKVSLPALQMKPIYWSPVNDIVTVLRGTWFYK